MTLAVCAAAGVESLTLVKLLAVGLITLGTGVSTAVESGTSGFAWVGFAAFTLSALMEAGRIVYIQLLLGRLKYNEVCF